MRKLRVIKVVLVVVFIISLGYGVYYTTNYSATNYRVKNDSYQSSKIPKEFNNFKLCFVSDLNLSDEKSLTRFKKIVKDINSQDIDMFIFGGDIYNSTIFDNAKVSNIFKDIKTKYGKFAVLGEKDFIDTSATSAILNDGGFEILHNEARKIYYKNQSISLFGLENNGDCSTLISADNEKNYKLVVVHQPDYFSTTSNSKIDLQLSGHTYGGVIDLPLYGGVYRKDHGSKYTFGKHSINDSKLLISNGISLEADKNWRLFTENEINIITLKHS